jgi:hypothetical protein
LKTPIIGEVIGGNILNGFAAETDFLAIGENNFHTHDVVFGYTVFEAAQSAGVFSNRTAHCSGCNSSRVRGIDQAVYGNSRVEGCNDNARLNNSGKVGCIDFKNLVHSLERENYTLLERDCAATQVRSGSAWIDRNFVRAGKVYNLLNHFSACWHNDYIGCLCRDIGSSIIAV